MAEGSQDSIVYRRGILLYNQQQIRIPGTHREITLVRELGHHDRALYLTLLINFTVMGGVVTLFGAAMSKVIETYSWSYTDVGAVYAASSLGFFTSSLVAGFLIDRFGSKPVILIGLSAEAISLMFFARTPSVALNVGLNFIIGLGLGSNEAITNVAVVRVEERGKSRLMNLMHAFWCVGAVVGPLGVANLIRARGAWQLIFPAFGALILTLGVLLAFQRFPKPAGARRAAGTGEEAGDLAERVRPLEYLKRSFGVRTGSIVLLCALSIFIYIGVEKGVYSWVSEFFVRVLGAQVSLGAAMVALYWAGQFAGRLGISVAYRGSRLEAVLALLASMTVVTLVVLVFVHVTWIAVICTFIAGVANSGIFPLIISLTGKYSSRGRSVGLVTSAGGIAGFLFPLFVATVSDAIGISGGFETVVFISVVLLAVILVVGARVRRLDRDDSSKDVSEVRIA